MSSPGLVTLQLPRTSVMMRDIPYMETPHEHIPTLEAPSTRVHLG